MQIIFLNTWYGKKIASLLEFVKKTKDDTLAYCFQETDSVLDLKLSGVLSDFTLIHDGTKTRNKYHPEYGQSIYLKKSTTLFNSKRIDVYKNRYPNYGFIQHIEIHVKGDKIFNILNYHGRSQPGHKVDTKTRIESSKRILTLIRGMKGEVILGGDFNLLPKTRSIKIIERFGLENLIDKYNIKTTRNTLAWRESRKSGQQGKYKYFGKQLYADYCFVTKK